MESVSFLALMVCANAMASDQAIIAQLQKKVPLHEHPTLVSMLVRSNELRNSVGLRPQKINAKLTQAAQDHARYMARTGSFSHYSNGGPGGRAQKFGFRAGVYENIAMGQRTVKDAFRAWRISSGHWRAITSNTSDAGFGYAISENGRQYWVSVYGTPPATPAKTPITPASATTTGEPKE